jgi:translation initiation factor 3 subunit M
MLELLGTYSDEDASHARDHAHRCIVTCLGDVNTFLFDHLLLLKPVKFLEGELIHDLLSIFVTGTLQVQLQKVAFSLLAFYMKT